MNGTTKTLGLAGAVLAVGMLVTSVDGLAQTADKFRIAPAASEKAAPVLLQTERLDVDDDGTMDIVAYYDVDGDGSVDSEVIDLGGTGEADIIAIRCDADGDGRADDWAVVDAKTEEVRAALIDGDDDGETELVSYGTGEPEPIGGESPIVRTSNIH